MKALVLSLLVVFFPLVACKLEVMGEPQLKPPLAVTPLDSSHETLKNRITTYLNSLGSPSPGKQLVGQNMGHGDWSGSYHFTTTLSALVNQSGKKPSLVGVDLGFKDYSQDYTQVLADLQTHWQSGGLITLSAHLPNLKTLGDIWDTDFTSQDFQDLLTEGTKIRSRWLIILSNLANFFQELKDRHVVVFWRPFHEMNGGWFWYGNSQNPPTQAQFIQLWKDMYQYFSVQRQLDNLLWVYSPHTKMDVLQPDTDYYYPGSSFTDVTALDYYGDEMNLLDSYSSYTKLLALNKPLGLGEVGSKNQRDGNFDNQKYLQLGSLYPKVSFFLVWHSWQGNAVALPDNKNASALMNSTQIITLDEVSY